MTVEDAVRLERIVHEFAERRVAVLGDLVEQAACVSLHQPPAEQLEGEPPPPPEQADWESRAIEAEQRVEQRAVVLPIVGRRRLGQRCEVDAVQRLHERAHVRQLVLAGSVDDRRHQVREHRVGTVPPDPVR